MTLRGAPFPPRPKAIATFISSEDFLPGVQTLLHSLKTHLAPTPKDQYPPEIVVLVSSLYNAAASTKLHQILCPAFCDRIIVANYFPVIAKDSTDNEEEENNKPSHVQSWSWDEKCGWTKLHLFELEEYDTMLYIDADCVVVKDVGHLLHIDEQNDSDTTNADEKRMGLLAAAPGIYPPDKFNAGVMVLRPSKAVFDDMVACLPTSTSNGATTKPCTSYDGGDTGFLNSFYPGWYSEMPSYSRLPVGYNAQCYIHHSRGGKQPKYWDEAIVDLRIIHYSSSPKPWDAKIKAASRDAASDQQSYLDGDDAPKVIDGELETIWQKAHEMSQKYYDQYQSMPREKCDYKSVAARQQHKTASRKPPPRSASSSMPASARSSSSISSSSAHSTTPKNAHQLVHKRYKELRKTGMGTKEAMSMARSEYGLDQNDTMDPSRAVGQMFGLM